MTKYLIAIKGSDGEVWLKPENPHKELLTLIVGRIIHTPVNPEWATFEREHPAYPLHNYTLTPGDRVEADGFELVWQVKGKSLRNWTTAISQDLTENDIDELEANFVKTRQVYIPVASKEGEKEESKVDEAIKAYWNQLHFWQDPNPLDLIKFIKTYGTEQ